MKPNFSRWLWFALLVSVGVSASAKEVKLLNASYDPTRELYAAFNAEFAKEWKRKTGDTLVVQQSHGGSGKQARSVIDGLQADVVTLALAFDIDAISSRGRLLPTNWQSRLPNNSAPYFSTMVFLVRKGNPKNIKNWEDLVRPGVGVITPNPRTSGGARWGYLAAWGYAERELHYDEAETLDFMRKLFKNVLVLDSGARGATTSFVQRNMGDVLITWENEALLSLREVGASAVEIVRPGISILAEPAVAWVDKVVDRHGTAELAKAYLNYLYSPEGQTLAARHFYRPRLESIAAKYQEQFPKMQMFTIDEAFGGWAKAHAEHFSDNGTFDRVQRAGR
jgi:sulfate transport system substrate-binding protein